MIIDTPAIVCAARSHGEHGAIVRLLTADHGMQAGFVAGGRGRRLRAVLIAGNLVQARLRSRTPAQLAQCEVELLHSRAPLLAEPLPAAAIEWATALAATVLPEAQSYPRVHAALEALLALIEAAPSASGWGAVLVRFELLVLAELGFGLDLASCAVSGDRDGLVAVSPRSGRAVSAAVAAPYSDRLLPLPGFVLDGGSGRWSEIIEGLALSGHFLLRDLLNDRASTVVDARLRLIERLRRAAGP